MKSFLPVLLATLAFASISSAQVSGDIRDGNHMAPPAGAFQDYPGALAAGNYCTNCGFENKTDAPVSGLLVPAETET